MPTEPATMRAAVLYGLKDIKVASRPLPKPAEGFVLIRVKAVGVCGSDLHTYLEGSTTGPARVEPIVLGHELAGTVTHEAARATGLPADALVAVDPADPCGSCEFCHRGHTNLCPNVRFLGFAPHDGGMAEFVSVPARALHLLPAGMDAVTGVMLEPLGVAIHAMDLARPRLGETVAVIGCGPIGLLLLQVAKAAGCGRLVAIDPVACRRDMAGALGADDTASDVSEVAALTRGRGVDLAIESTDQPTGLQLAAKAARIGGRAVIVGIPEGNAYTLNAAEARRKGLTVKFARRMSEVYPRAIALAETGRIKLAPLASHHFPLEQAPKAFALQVSRNDSIIKAILYP